MLPVVRLVGVISSPIMSIFLLLSRNSGANQQRSNLRYRCLLIATLPKSAMTALNYHDDLNFSLAKRFL